MVTKTSNKALLQAIECDDFIKGLQQQIHERIMEIVAAEYDDDGGFCSYSWHRSLAEFNDRGLCTICSEPKEAHVSILVCKDEVEEG